MFKLNVILEAAKKKIVFVFFGSLFILLLFVYWPSLTHPPRSDYWATAYFFHEINISGDLVNRWLQLLQFDPWTQVRFQPLAFPVLYFEQMIFGSNFIYFHVVNIILYFISVLLLYELAAFFCANKPLTAAFIGVFALLFSHSDIISWTYHIYFILGFCFLLEGFVLYLRFLQSGRKTLLLMTGLFFLSGLLCYETFVFWPLAAIILSFIGELNEKTVVKKPDACKSGFLLTASVYSFYALFFCLSRKFSVYSSPLISLNLLPSLKEIIFSFSAACFNIFYNGILINIMPSLAFPLVINENLNLGGLIIKASSPQLRGFIYYSGALFTAISLITAVYFLRRKSFNVLKVTGFFLFLLFSNFFLLFHLRKMTNNSVFILTQFRYLYVPNAFIFLISLYMAHRFCGFSRKRLAAVYVLLFFVLASNIYAAQKVIAVTDEQLAPLKSMLLDIKEGIKNKRISVQAPLFIGDDIVKRLPALCWNKDMGELFMKGTYQWVFSEEEIKCFSSWEKAVWVVNKDNFKIAVKIND